MEHMEKNIYIHVSAAILWINLAYNPQFLDNSWRFVVTNLQKVFPAV
jgi:hypothetical protein